MKYFKITDFDSPDEPGSGKVMNKEVLSMLDESRSLAGIAFWVTSGYRTEVYNKSVGGKENSAHLDGLGVDVKCDNSRARIKMIRAFLEVGFHRIGIGETFIHVDNDKTKDPEVCWLY